MIRNKFAAFAFVVMLFVTLTVVGEDVKSDTDTLPPYTWDHFPPREASNVSPTTDLAFKVTDKGSGVLLSSVYLLIDGDIALTRYYPMDQKGQTYLFVCPNVGPSEPGQVLSVSIDAEDVGGNRMSGDRYHLTTCASAPRMNSGGYMFSNLSSEGGTLTIAGDISWPMCGLGDMGVYLGFTRTGISLRDDGTGGDLINDDGIFMTQLDLGPGLAPGDILLSILARDYIGYAGFAWPFFGATWEFVPDPFPVYSEEDTQRWKQLVDAYIVANGPPDGYRPVIVTAGYWHTRLWRTGGYLYMSALILDPDGPEDVATVAVYDSRTGLPTGIYMNDQGLDGDLVPGDDIYTATYGAVLGADPNKLYLFRIVAFDMNGNSSDPWPFIRIHE